MEYDADKDIHYMTIAVTGTRMRALRNRHEDLRDLLFQEASIVIRNAVDAWCEAAVPKCNLSPAGHGGAR